MKNMNPITEREKAVRRFNEQRNFQDALAASTATEPDQGATKVVAAVASGSESSTHWLLGGQRKQDPRRWDAIGHNADTEDEARAEERSYREYMAAEKTGWLDFRVVRVTTTREIIPNKVDSTTCNP